MYFLKKVILNKKGYEYIHDCLDNGNILSNLVLKNIDFMKGEIYTYIPEYVSNEKIYEFRGGIYKLNNSDQEIKYKLPNGQIGAIHKSGYIANAEYGLIGDIIKDFEMGISTTGLFEDPVAGPELLKYHEYDYAAQYKTTLYWYLQKGMDSKKMFEIITDIPNFSPPLIGFIYLDNDIQLGNYPVLSGEYLLKVAKNVHKIIVGAYDSEGYLIWVKDKK